MFLYEVILPGGRTNENWLPFFENIGRLNGKAPDYGGINNVALVKHHMDEVTLKSICTEGFKGRANDRVVEIREITAKTMKTPPHGIYTDLIEACFLPHDSFPNIEE